MYTSAEVTQQTVLPDQPDDSVDSGPSQSPSFADPVSRDAIGAALLKQLGADVPDRQASNANDDTDDDSAPGNAASDGVNPEQDQPTSRRGNATQRTIADMRAEIEQLKAKVEAPLDVGQQPPADDPINAELEKAQDTVRTLLGTDDDWTDLQSRVVDGLSFEDSERYRRMQAARLFEREWSTLSRAIATKDFTRYRDGFFSNINAAFAAVGQEPGVDADFVSSSNDLGAVFKHVYQAGRKDLADENERLRGELKQARAQRLGSSPRLPNGGRSSIGLSDRPDPRTADPLETLNAGIRQRSGAKR